MPISWTLLLGLAVATSHGAPWDHARFTCLPDRSTLRYTVVHPFNTVHGASRTPACTVWIDADTSRFRVRVTAAVRSFESGNRLRDSHAMDAVDADQHPQVVFTSGSVTPKEGRLGPYSISGTLRLHGVEKSVTVEARPELRGDTAFVRGRFPILLTDYGVERPSLFFIPVRDRAEIAFDLAFDLGTSRP